MGEKEKRNRLIKEVLKCMSLQQEINKIIAKWESVYNNVESHIQELEQSIQEINETLGEDEVN